MLALMIGMCTRAKEMDMGVDRGVLGMCEKAQKGPRGQ